MTSSIAILSLIRLLFTFLIFFSYPLISKGLVNDPVIGIGPVQVSETSPVLNNYFQDVKKNNFHSAFLFQNQRLQEVSFSVFNLGLGLSQKSAPQLSYTLGISGGFSEQSQNLYSQKRQLLGGHLGAEYRLSNVFNNKLLKGFLISYQYKFFWLEKSKQSWNQKTGQTTASFISGPSVTLGYLYGFNSSWDGFISVSSELEDNEKFFPSLGLYYLW